MEKFYNWNMYAIFQVDVTTLLRIRICGLLGIFKIQTRMYMKSKVYYIYI